ncbi:CYTH-like domain-containing protein [Microdochium trichocladiopsis]|uniref:mRNA-capping enzyme subunit beta n=1 Tax=Microdochium trichocladiopsis TaxID=1682393 RepID=A0A9P8XWZ9_9PEZI|nr:CYTH-like domain-containing protein [Microdochium trichocladiopsis]KAH7021456.1 CYTH-like domain-containing protein [Microdochium trichocladiopsis]
MTNDDDDKNQTLLQLRETYGASVATQLARIVHDQNQQEHHRLLSFITSLECLQPKGLRLIRKSINCLLERQYVALSYNWLASENESPASGRYQVPGWDGYTRRKEIDSSYDLPPDLHPRLPFALRKLLEGSKLPRVRISRDDKGNVLAKIAKARLADWQIWMPNTPLDARISVNLEWEWDGPVEEIEANHLPNRDKAPNRNKNRLSYTHGFYQVDLTQVTYTTPGRASAKEHEIEVEFDGNILVEHGRREMAKQPIRYIDLIDGLLDSVRALARQCPHPHSG